MRAAEFLRRARVAAALTQAQLAERVGTTQSAIARLETGAAEPTLARLDLLVRACGLQLEVDVAGTPTARRTTALEPHDVQDRWDAAVRAANFVLAGRHALGRR